MTLRYRLARILLLWSIIVDRSVFDQVLSHERMHWDLSKKNVR